MISSTCARAVAGLVLLMAAGAAAGCGKKGPPLAPLVKVPAAPEDASARRTGNDVLIQLRIPGANGDGSRPADIDRVNVYALTGATSAPPEMVKYGTLVASIRVRRPPDEDEEPAAAPRPPASLANGFDQGDVVTITETLGPAQLKPIDVPRPRGGRAAAAPGVDPWQPDLQPKPRPDQTRFYVAVGVNHKGQRGAFTPPQPVPLATVLVRPAKPTIEYDPSGVTLSWPAAPDLRQPIQRPAEEGQLTSTSRAVRGMIGGYNVYELVPTPPAPAAASNASVAGAGSKPAPAAPATPPSAPTPTPAAPAGAAPAPATAPAAPPAAPPAAKPGVSAAPPALPKPGGAPAGTAAAVPRVPAVVPGALAKPLNDKPLEATSFTDPRIEFGKERCYVVRTVAASGAQIAESTSSPPACVTPADTFPPAAPKGLAAVASEGAISLIWEANAEGDLAGYVVMRSEANGAAQPLMSQPIKETTFRDTTAVRGVLYTYTVLAVDASGNRSGPSNAVDETAR